MTLSPPPPPSSSSDGFHLTPRMIIAAVLGVLAIVFVFQNTETAKLKIIFFTVEMPRWIAFVVLLLIGAIIGFLIRRAREK